MKTLLTLVFILIATVGFSQKKSDTLVVDFSKYHYIKIGEKVYKIESPTLTEVRGSIRSLGLTIIDTTPCFKQFYRYDTLRLPKLGTQPVYSTF